MFDEMNLFDLPHTLYVIISFALMAVGIALLIKFCKEERKKDLVLKISALGTVIIHYSDLWVEYLKTGSATIGSNQLFAVYPCNIMMWLLLFAAFWKKKDGVFRTILNESVFCVGTICGVVGILFNINYNDVPNLFDYEIFQGLLSHSTMVFGCIWLLAGKYIRIRAFNAVSALCCLLFFVADGIFIDTLFTACGLPPVNAMFLREVPFPELPWLTPAFFGVMVLLVFFGGLALYEQKAFPPEDRWYAKLSAWISKKTTKEK